MADQPSSTEADHPWGCGHITDAHGTVLNIQCVECYLDWYLDHRDD